MGLSAFPTLRGFVVGLALFIGVSAVSGCLDSARVFVDPTTGKEVSIKAGKIVPPQPGDDDFVGPVQPKTISERREAANADLDHTTRTVTTSLLWLLGVGSTAMLVLSLFVPWASIRVAGIGFAFMGAVILGRHALLSWGPWIADGSVYAGVLYLLYTVWHYFKLHKDIQVAAVQPSPTPLANFFARIGGLFAKPEVKP